MQVTRVPVTIVSGANMASPITSTVKQLILTYGYSVEATYTTSGTLGGVLALQASVDHQEDNQGNVLVPGTFVTITNSPVTLTGPGSFIWNVYVPMYPYMRLIYTPAMGDTGSLTAVLFERAAS